MPIESVMPSNQSSSIVLLLPAFNLFQHKGFSSESHLHIRWSKYCSFSFNISPSNEYSGLISFRVDWIDFLAVQGTLKSLLQHHSSKASIHQCSTLKFSPVTKSCLTLCDPMDCSTPGFPVHHQLPELTQTHAR